MPAPVYRQRDPQSTPYYQCIEDHFETFEQVYEDRFERRYGFYRPYVHQVICRYLDCGILHNGFARVRCKECGHEYLLAFSCKRRHFCPSCHQKRVVEFGEWLCHEVVKAIPHRHAVLSIPKILRRYFLYDRKLLSGLSRCGWEALKLYFKKVVKGQNIVPGAVIAIQTFGDFLGFNPHLHILISDGCFHENGMFSVAPAIDTKALEQIFRHMILKMLLTKGKINRDVITLLDKWRHTGFNVFLGSRILPWQKKSMENLARYIIRASFSQERMTYHRESGQVEYRSKASSRPRSGKGKKSKIFDALEWIAAMCSHVPNKGEQMVRYYGHYSNVSRGRRKKAHTDDQIPYILEPELSPKELRKNWARLIQKIYEVDPLTCPKCRGSMRVIAFIEDEDVIKKILRHLGLWVVKRKPLPRANAPPFIPDAYPVPSVDDYTRDPQYPTDSYF
ncbi:MAG: transposase [Deltaproteobacteria bacterium]|nr:transposase [Candidatus Desulfobacula maris]